MTFRSLTKAKYDFTITAGLGTGKEDCQGESCTRLSLDIKIRLRCRPSSIANSKSHIHVLGLDGATQVKCTPGFSEEDLGLGTVNALVLANRR